MSEIRRPFSSFHEFTLLLETAPACNEEARRRHKQRNDQLTKPPGSLGRLEDLAIWYASWRGYRFADIIAPRVLVFAGNHGVAKRGVSAYPSDVTAQMVRNFGNGGAAINQISRDAGAILKVVPLELERPTQDSVTGPAMTEDETIDAMVEGWHQAGAPCDLLAIGEMGIGNTTAAAAICMALFGDEAECWTGNGTGVGGEQLARKTAIVARAVERHEDDHSHPFEILQRLGGREIAAMAGAIARARIERQPVILDGFVCGAAAAVLHAVNTTWIEHTVAGHVSAEFAHKRLLRVINKRPILDLDMRLGEASGAALAIGILRAAVRTHNGMATFAEAGVSSRPK